MSELLLLNDRRVEKHLPTLGSEPWTSRSLTRSTAQSPIWRLLLIHCNQFQQQTLLRSESNKDYSKERKREKVT